MACGPGKQAFHIFWAVQGCYLSRPWWAAAAWRGTAPVLPWGGSECWSRSAPSQMSSRGQTPDTAQQCSQPSGRTELQTLSLLPGLENNSKPRGKLHWLVFTLDCLSYIKFLPETVSMMKWNMLRWWHTPRDALTTCLCLKPKPEGWNQEFMDFLGSFHAHGDDLTLHYTHSESAFAINNKKKMAHWIQQTQAGDNSFLLTITSCWFQLGVLLSVETTGP